MGPPTPPGHEPERSRSLHDHRIREWYARLLLTDFVESTDYAYFINLDPPACRRLMRRAVGLYELPSLIETIFSSKVECDTVHSLQGDDAQTFVDVMNEACYFRPSSLTF